jgi:NAD(P)H-dependent FMN reductase/GNAT superfamily N-acetyltransferase
MLICGSTRPGSSNSQALRAVEALDVPGLDIDRYDGLAALPGFVPDAAEPPRAVSDLLERIERSDAVLFSTPEYAGGLPGSLKNLLDWTVGGGQLYRKPVAWLDVANPGRGGGARLQLATVLRYVGAQVVGDACVRLTFDGGSPPALLPSSRADLAGAVQALWAASEGASTAGFSPGDPAVVVAPYPGDRERLRGLFELAEDSAVELDSYLQAGRVLTACLGSEVVGHLQLVDGTRAGDVEIKSMAVRPDLQRRGVGAQLLQAAVELARQERLTRVVVATAAADVGNLRFYQRQGFRLSEVERDAFTTANGYPAGLRVDDIELRDRVWLDRSTSPAGADDSGRQ